MRISDQEQRNIADFVKKKGALSAHMEEGADYYFKARFGRSLHAAKGEFPGVYLSKMSSPEELQQEVARHIRNSGRAAASKLRPDSMMFLCFFLKGQTNPEDVLPVDIEVNVLNEEDPAERIQRASGTGESFNAAAGIALLQTNDMLKNLVFRVLDDLRMAQDGKLDAQGLIVELMAKLDTASALVQVAEAESHGRRVDRFWQRMDPHIRELGPDIMSALNTAASGWSAKYAGGAANPCPDDPTKAIDWHIAQLAQSLNGLGLHLQTHADKLTDAHKAKLSKLLETILEAVASFDL